MNKLELMMLDAHLTEQHVELQIEPLKRALIEIQEAFDRCESAECLNDIARNAWPKGKESK